MHMKTVSAVMEACDDLRMSITSSVCDAVRAMYRTQTPCVFLAHSTSQLMRTLVLPDFVQFLARRGVQHAQADIWEHLKTVE
jgi:hypothetical protein